MKVYSYNRRRIKFVFVMAALALGVIVGRLAYIMLYRGEYYSEKADSLHERERSIKAQGKDIRQKWQYHSGQQGGVFNIRDTQPDRG